jgi:hypothetical protein
MIKICKSDNPDEVGEYNTLLLCGGIWVQGSALGFIPVLFRFLYYNGH